MRLYLIRHGETPWTVAGRYQGLTDVPLSRRGIRQAKALARALKADRPSFLYTSTLRRARDTARYIGAKIGVREIMDARLNELDFGKWEGAPYRRLARSGGSQFRKWREGKLRRPPGGESIVSLARRAGKFLEEITRRHPRQTVAVVAHGGPIKMILFKALKAEDCSIGSFRIDPASITLVEGDQRLFQIAWTNRVDY